MSSRETEACHRTISLFRISFPFIFSNLLKVRSGGTTVSTAGYFKDVISLKNITGKAKQVSSSLFGCAFYKTDSVVF